jgi:hypothetical protein
MNAVLETRENQTVELNAADEADLREAVERLESPGFGARLANFLGGPVEGVLNRLPPPAREAVHNGARRAIAKCLDVAVGSLEGGSQPAADRFHRALVGLTGAAGGAGGLFVLPIELPLTTVIMMRSIADIARSEGEDLRTVDSRLACLEVFALGGRSANDDAAETAYYVVRAALSQAMREAASYIAERGFAEQGAPAVVRFVATVASRFGVVVSEKAAAQAIPVIGAAAGAAVNLIFTDHFQSIAHGHFAVRRLERRYGPEAVRRAYTEISADS